MKVWKLQISKNSRVEATNQSDLLLYIWQKSLGDQLQNILSKVIEPTSKEEGNIAYVLHRSLDNPDGLMFDEIWVDKECLEAHLKPYIKSALEQMKSILAEPVELRRYSEISK